AAAHDPHAALVRADPCMALCRRRVRLCLLEKRRASAADRQFVRETVSLRHRRTVSSPDRYPAGVEVLETEDIHTEVVGGHALAVERIDTADPAKVVARSAGVELVLRERLAAGQQA